MFSIVLVMLACLCSVIQIVTVEVFQINPNHVIDWHGCHTDFSSFVINPALFKSLLISLATCLHSWSTCSIIQPSSRNKAIFTPCILQYFSRGFKHFVNIYGAEASPNGNTVKTKYLQSLSWGPFQQNPRNVWDAEWISMWWYPLLKSKDII